MEIIKCRPILVESKNKSSLIGKYKDTGNLVFNNTLKDIERGEPMELIFISLNPDEKIKDGDLVYDKEAKYIRILNYKWNETDFDVKVIATQSQIPPEYIQQFIEEYNINSVKDIDIEMEEYDHDEEWSEISGAYETCRYRPKLINGFISIVKERLFNQSDIDKFEIKLPNINLDLIDWWKGNHPKTRYEMIQHCYPKYTGKITITMIETIFNTYKDKSDKEIIDYVFKDTNWEAKLAIENIPELPHVINTVRELRRYYVDALQLGYNKRKSEEAILYTEEEVRTMIGNLTSEFICNDGIFFKRKDIKINEIYNWFEQNKKK